MPAGRERRRAGAADHAGPDRGRRDRGRWRIRRRADLGRQRDALRARDAGGLPLAARVIVGTDIFHAAALLFVAGFGHLVAGNVDLGAIGWLLVGSIPGVLIGSQVSVGLPERILRLALAAALMPQRAEASRGSLLEPDRRRVALGRARRPRRLGPPTGAPAGTEDARRFAASHARRSRSRADAKHDREG